MDIVERCKASATSETCLEAVAAKEIERLRKIEAAAVVVEDVAFDWRGANSQAIECASKIRELEKANG